MRFRRYLTAVQRMRAQSRISITDLLVGLGGVAALVGCIAVFAGATEDVTQHNGLALRDAANLRFFTAHRSDLLVHVAKIVSDAGAVAVVGGLAILAGVLMWRRGARAAIALAPTVSFGVAAAAVVIAKTIVGRTRPPVALHLVSESDASFPSGHATDSAAVLVTIALVLALFLLHRPIARVLSVLGAGLLAGAIGASRLMLGVHWPSDVLAGWALGISIAIAVTISAALLARVIPPTPDESGGLIRRLTADVTRLLAAERRPRRELRAT